MFPCPADARCLADAHRRSPASSSPQCASSAFTSVPSGLPGAGCTTRPGGLSSTIRSASSNRIVNGIACGCGVAGTGGGRSACSVTPAAPSRPARQQATSRRACPASISALTRERHSVPIAAARNRSTRSPAACRPRRWWQPAGRHGGGAIVAWDCAITRSGTAGERRGAACAFLQVGDHCHGRADPGRHGGGDRAVLIAPADCTPLPRSARPWPDRCCSTSPPAPGSPLSPPPPANGWLLQLPGGGPDRVVLLDPRGGGVAGAGGAGARREPDLYWPRAAPR